MPCWKGVEVVLRQHPLMPLALLRVIVIGRTDLGKSSLSAMLLSWVAKQGWKPTFVDLDIGQGSITIPGCIAATPVEMHIDPVEGIPLEMSLAYYFGHPTPTANADLYKFLVKELAQILEREFAGNAESRAAGMVINTMGWVEGLGYELLLHSIDACPQCKCSSGYWSGRRSRTLHHHLVSFPANTSIMGTLTWGET